MSIWTDQLTISSEFLLIQAKAGFGLRLVTLSRMYRYTKIIKTFKHLMFCNNIGNKLDLKSQTLKKVSKLVVNISILDFELVQIPSKTGS